MPGPKVSIVIPVFNAEEHLEACLTSVVNQSYDSIEIVVVDGASTDKSLDIAKKFSGRIAHLISERDRGIYDAMNKGLNLVTGDWVYFLGANDRLADSFVLSEIFESDHTDVDLLLGSVNYENLHSKKVPHVHTCTFGPGLDWKNTVHHQGALYSRDLFKGKPFNTKYKVLADYDFNLGLDRTATRTASFDMLIAKCDGAGISKRFKWSLYKEELKIKKTHHSFLRFLLLDIPFVFSKFLYKNWGK